MTSNNYPIIIVGASITAISFIRTMREHGDKRRILLVHGEDRLPYKRTKINKNMVRGFDKDDFRLADQTWYDENEIDLIMDRVIHITASEKLIHTKSGQIYSYEKLLLATGVAPVVPVINGIDRKDIHSVQNANDVERLLEECKEQKRFLIIGGGVEGIETADQLVRKGKQVTVANRMRYPLQKLFPDVLAKELEYKMKAKGVQLFDGVSVASVNVQADGSYKLQLKGETLFFDVIVACAGATPNIDLARKTGLKTERGILVNEYLETSDQDILAGGDVAQHARGVVTGLWHAAEHQGKLAALNVLGKKEAHTLPPYRLKTEVFDLYMFSAAYDEVIPGRDLAVEEKHGDIHRIMYYQDDKLKASVFVNDGDRAKTYQKALFEAWDKAKIEAELPLPPKLQFSFMG